MKEIWSEQKQRDFVATQQVLYEKNEEFLHKAIFAVSAFAFPLLASKKEARVIMQSDAFSADRFLLAALTLFIACIITEMFSFRSAKSAANLLSGDKFMDGVPKVKNAIALNSCRDYFFIAALLATLLATSL